MFSKKGDNNDNDNDNKDGKKKDLHTTDQKRICKSDRNEPGSFLREKARAILNRKSPWSDSETPQSPVIKPTTMEAYESLKVIETVLRRKGTGRCSGITIKEVQRHMNKIVSSGKALPVFISFAEIPLKWDDDKILIEIFKYASIDIVVELLRYCIDACPPRHACVDFLFRRDYLISDMRVKHEYIYYCLVKHNHAAVREAIKNYEGSLLDDNRFQWFFSNSLLKADHDVHNEMRARENMSPKIWDHEHEYPPHFLKPSGKASGTH